MSTTFTAGENTLQLQPFSGITRETSLAAAEDLIRLKNALGISLIVKDDNLHDIDCKFDSVSALLHNPEFLTHLSQQLYVCDPSETIWFSIRLRNGKQFAITFELECKINWATYVNKDRETFAFVYAGYCAGQNSKNAITLIPRKDFCESRIANCFPKLLGETATNAKNIGRLVLYLLQKKLKEPPVNGPFYIAKLQGFTTDWRGNSCFSPPHLIPAGIEKTLSASVQNRQYPAGPYSDNDDLSPVLKPMFDGQPKLQILLLSHIVGWLQFLYARYGVFCDNILEVKPTPLVPPDTIVAIAKNTRYDNLDVPPIGPQTKLLQRELETVNDGTVVVLDIFRADELKKAERGYDMLLNDVSGAVGSDAGLHHTVTLVSKYADLYLPEDRCCLLDMTDVETEFSPEAFRSAMKRLDASLVTRIEHGCRQQIKGVIDLDQGLSLTIKQHIEHIRSNLPWGLPRSRINSYIMLLTAHRIYDDWFSPLFYADIEQRIADWLLSQGQEHEQQSLDDCICSEFGSILNKKIADGAFKLIHKDAVTVIDKGNHTIIVDQAKRRIYVEPADSFTIVHEDMKTISDTDRLTTALYNCEYLPHTPKAEKSIRIAAITSDGVPYHLYVHAIDFTLLSQENQQRFDLIDKDPFLFRQTELPAEQFLPLIKTVDGRFAGKKLDIAADASHHYFGSGRNGSGKSWALGQLMPMLKMLGCNVIVFDTSSSFTEAQLQRMLPTEVVDKLFRFSHIEEQDRIPVDLSSLSECCSLPDRKRVIFKIMSAAVGKFDRDRFKDNQQQTALKSFLSSYLKDKHDRVDLDALTEELRSSAVLNTHVTDVLCSVFQEIAKIGSEKRSWSDLFSDENRIVVLDLGNESGDSSHVLLDILTASLFTWQQLHNERQLAIFIDELADQNFAEHSPLNTILKQGRKFHTALLGATQDFYGQGNSCLDVLKQATIKSFARPGKSEDRIAEKLGYANAADAGFPQFGSGDVIMELDALNKETGENEPVTIRGRVVNFAETPLYDRFLQEFGHDCDQERRSNRANVSAEAASITAAEAKTPS